MTLISSPGRGPRRCEIGPPGGVVDGRATPSRRFSRPSIRPRRRRRSSRSRSVQLAAGAGRRDIAHGMPAHVHRPGPARLERDRTGECPAGEPGRGGPRPRAPRRTPGPAGPKSRRASPPDSLGSSPSYHGRVPVTLRTHPTATTREIDLSVQGYNLRRPCAVRVQKKLGKLDGVTAAVNYATGTARGHRARPACRSRR